MDGNDLDLWKNCINFLIREMIFDKYKSVHSIELFFTGGMKILNFLIRGIILKIINFIILKKLNFLVRGIILKIIKVCGIQHYFLRRMKILNFLIGEMIFENHKSVHSIDLFFMEMKILNFLFNKI